MTTLNRKVVKWLEQGHLREALIGEDDFFLLDYGDPNRHDVMLVVYVLINWALQSERVREIGVEFQKILMELSTTHPDELMDILLAYTITARDLNKQLPCNLGLVFETLRAGLLANVPDRSDFDLTITARITDLRQRLLQLGVELKAG